MTMAFENWDTNLRLFKTSQGEEPNSEIKRLTLLQMLPADVSAYVAMHMELAELSTYAGMKRFRYEVCRGHAEPPAQGLRASLHS